MELDRLKAAWQAHGEALATAPEPRGPQVGPVAVRRLRFALVPYALWLGVEIVIGVVAMVLVTLVGMRHLGEGRYLLLAGAVLGFALAITAACVHLLVRIARLDYTAPVAALQRDVARTKLVAFRAAKWALLGGVVLWLPVALLLFELATGVPALAKVDGAWLLANVGFGGLLLAAGQWLARRYVERAAGAPLRPWAQHCVDALAGRSLQSASAMLAELDEVVAAP